ncbi:MAG: 23S rRNA (adenine(2503)-C(2))-methyltransferase RlmN [Phycisphaerae bacterium]|nr:23S rRNA (adenine(2503)-C(2))-methyltransferase RlmN [Phycisphaerae bacterium]
MRHPVMHIFEQTPETLAEWCRARGMAHFRAAQVLEWVYGTGVVDPAAMSNLSRADRECLTREMTFLSGRAMRDVTASDGTRKLLIQWDDPDVPAACGTPEHDEARGERAVAEGVPLPMIASAPARPVDDPSRQTECVMIPSEERRTACISSQVGCPVGCRFCASGLGGLDGNLSAGRIVEQVWRLRDVLRRQGDPEARITNVVFMGMGEPLANFRSVAPAIRILNAPWGMGISGRKITVSTVGLPGAIERLAEQLDVPVTLALSLHAPTDEIRRRLIPWAEYTTIADLLGACRKWFEKTGREITLEYTLLRGVNDGAEHAEELARLARTLRANINLIRYNEVAGLPFKRPRDEDVRRFQEVLRERRINAHIRASRGRDIEAACGQLRREGGKGSNGHMGQGPDGPMGEDGGGGGVGGGEGEGR